MILVFRRPVSGNRVSSTVLAGLRFGNDFLFLRIVAVVVVVVDTPADVDDNVLSGLL